MNRAVVITMLIGLLYLASCGVKEPCEQNNTGEICVQNYSGRNVEVYINNVRALTLADNTENCVVKPIGNYSVRFISFTDENTITVNVEQCKATTVSVSF